MLAGEAEHHLGLERALDVEVELDLREAADQAVAGGRRRYRAWRASLAKACRSLARCLRTVAVPWVRSRPRDAAHDRRDRRRRAARRRLRSGARLSRASLGLPPVRRRAVIALLDEGNTVPFIARYRKERTGGLDEVQIRAIEERRDLPRRARGAARGDPRVDRRAGQAHPRARGQAARGATARPSSRISTCRTSPSAARRAPRSRASAGSSRSRSASSRSARDGDPAAEAAAFVDASRRSPTPTTRSPARATSSPRSIAETAEVRALVRARVRRARRAGRRRCVPGKDDEPTKFEQYYDVRGAGADDPVAPLPRDPPRRGRGRAARARRGRHRAGRGRHPARLAKLDPASPWAAQLELAVADALKRLLAPSVENDVRAELKLRSDGAAVDVFAGNLRNLLLAAPLGTRGGARHRSGPAHRLQVRGGRRDRQVPRHGHRLPHAGRRAAREGEGRLPRVRAEVHSRARSRSATAPAAARPRRSCKRGARRRGLREGRRRAVRRAGQRGRRERVLARRDVAREEFPDLDLTIRGAISIARRLQDPLAELVKIDPKSIGVGQYQHDVHQPLLAQEARRGRRELRQPRRRRAQHRERAAARATSPASARRSRRRSSRTATSTARSTSRAQLLEVSGLGPEGVRAGGGLPARSRTRAHPLDASAVHPERYALVERIATDLGVALPRADRQPGARRQDRPLEVRRPATSASRRCATSSPSSRSPAAIRAPSSSRRSSATT